MAEPASTPVVTPLPVLIAEEQHPIPVVVAPNSPSMPGAPVSKSENLTMPPTTTAAEDKVTEGQRHISRVWEYVQAGIAFSVTSTTLLVLAKLALSAEEPSGNQLQVVGHLMVMTTMILTFYYQRTNHQNIGGIGPKANEPPYRGR